MKKVLVPEIFGGRYWVGHSDLDVVGHNALGEELVRVFDEHGAPCQERLKDLAIFIDQPDDNL